LTKLRKTTDTDSEALAVCPESALTSGEFPAGFALQLNPLRPTARGRLSDPEHTQKRSPSPAEKKLETFIQQDSKLAHVGDSNESDGDGGIDLLNEHLRLQLSTDRTPTPAGKPLHPLSFSFRSLVVAENFNEIRENSPTTAFV
jgi:hypothetical protein